MQADGPDGFENNEALVAQALRDSAAFGSVVILYYRMVFSVAYAYLQDSEAAEELTQETFLRAFLHLDKLREPRTLPAWLNRIARNESLKWIEKRQVRSRLMPTVPLEAIPMNLADEEQPTPCQQAETQDERAGIRESLSRLPADVREVVVMHYIENVGKSEIARRLNLHPSSVGRKLTRGLEQLRNDAAVSELRGYAPRLTSRAQAASAAIVAVAALPAGTRAALAAKCADSGILAAVMPAPVSSGGIVGALTGSAIAKTLVAVVSVGVIAGAMVHLGGRHTPREDGTARGSRQTGASGIHPNRSTGRLPTPAKRAAARLTGHGPASAPIAARAH